MRIAITFVRKNGKPLILPIHYNEKIQGIIYRNLSKSLSDWLHTTGYEKGKRKFKGFIIKGWMGIYELHLPEPYLSMALDADLGAKNSQGFGMVEVIETMRPNTTGK